MARLGAERSRRAASEAVPAARHWRGRRWGRTPRPGTPLDILLSPPLAAAAGGMRPMMGRPPLPGPQQLERKSCAAGRSRGPALDGADGSMRRDSRPTRSWRTPPRRGSGPEGLRRRHRAHARRFQRQYGRSDARQGRLAGALATAVHLRPRAGRPPAAPVQRRPVAPAGYGGQNELPASGGRPAETEADAD